MSIHFWYWVGMYACLWIGWTFGIRHADNKWIQWMRDQELRR